MQKHMINLDYLSLLYKGLFFIQLWGSFISFLGKFCFFIYILNYPKKVLGTILIDGGYQTKRRNSTSIEEEIEYYEKDFEEHVGTWEKFLDVAVFGDSRRTPLLMTAAKDLALVKDGKCIIGTEGEKRLVTLLKVCTKMKRRISMKNSLIT
ncbi:hypothetical protein M1D49_19640 [Bacillus sp. PK3-056]|uniref:hypothetical protein n=1 Tax=Niallia circulans TaxID=1397 RepID=UPI000F450C7F|nr:hypothetical protein [Niallia circulans]AYV71861.1 hypothetical protein C2H98_09780 [Niallia circulans]